LLTLFLSHARRGRTTHRRSDQSRPAPPSRLGFSDVWLTEHYFTAKASTRHSLMFAAALAMRPSASASALPSCRCPSIIRGGSRAAGAARQLSKGRIDVGVGKGTVYNEYEFVGHGLRSHDSRERMEEAVDNHRARWRESPAHLQRQIPQVQIPAIRPKPVQQPGPAVALGDLARLVQRLRPLGVPILTARLRRAHQGAAGRTYEAGIGEGGHDERTRARLLAQSALWRNVYVARVGRPGRG